MIKISRFPMLNTVNNFFLPDESFEGKVEINLNKLFKYKSCE